MPTRDTISQWWDRIRTSLWFVPGLMALAAVVLAFLAPVLDRAISDAWLRRLPFVFAGRPTGARAVLSTIATAMISTAGVVFSMTIVSLQLASSQFGPRLLRTFLRDRGNQVVLGTFVGIFLYCILVLPAIDGAADAAFTLHISVTIALLLAVVGLAMLVYFIDHVAQSIHADAVIESVGCELDGVIDTLFPEPVGDGDQGEAFDQDGELPGPGEGRQQPLRATEHGYLRFVNGDVLMEVAVEGDVAVYVKVAPGQYMFEGDTIATVRSGSAVTDELAARIRSTFVVGAHRTLLQDVSFAFEQLAEMAMRALSPGINDPTTAIHCIDRIGSGLSCLVTRSLPSPLRRDAEGVVRVVAEPVRLERILEATLDAIASNAGAHASVWLRILAVLEKTGERARREHDRELLRRRARRVAERAERSVDDEGAAERIRAAASWATGSGAA